MSRFKNIPAHALICLIAGGLTPLAFAPFNITVVPIITLAVLFTVWCNNTPRWCFLHGYLFGFGLFGVGVNWLHISINLFGGVNVFGAYVLTYALVAFLALYPAFVGYLGKKYFAATQVGFLLALPPLWTLSEWLRAWLLTGFPWLNLGYSQIDTPLAGIAPVTGVYGISFVISAIAAVLVFILFATQRQKIVTSMVAVILLIGCYSLKSIDWTTPEKNDLSVTLAQAAIPQEMKWQEEKRQYTLELYLALSAPLEDTDLVIWPETAIPMFYHEAETFLQKLDAESRQNDTHLLTGIPYRDPGSGAYFNSIVMLGATPGMYHKRHLVPFGEYLPLDSWLRPVLDALGIPMSDFSAGNSDKPLVQAGNTNIGVSICYEDVFGEEVIDALPEATLLVNISNDAWFGDSIAPHQHLQMARMRALETGRYLLRATNTGISAIIDEKGRLKRRSPQFEPHAITASVSTFTGMTPYASAGNVPVILFMLMLLAGTWLRR